MKIEIDSKDLERFIRSMAPFDAMTDQDFWSACALMATLEMARLEEEAESKKKTPIVLATKYDINVDSFISPEEVLGVALSGTSATTAGAYTIQPPKPVFVRFIKTDYVGKIETIRALRSLTGWSLYDAKKFVDDGFDDIHKATRWMRFNHAFFDQKMSALSLNDKDKLCYEVCPGDHWSGAENYVQIQ